MRKVLQNTLKSGWDFLLIKRGDDEQQSDEKNIRSLFSEFGVESQWISRLSQK